MPEQVGDLFKSKATIWIAPVGEAFPDETAVAAEADWGGNWTKLGWTLEGIKFKYEYEDMEIAVEQILGPLSRRKTSESAMFETVLAEVTATNLAYAAGTDPTTLVTTTAAGASQAGYEEAAIGDNLLVQEYAIGLEGINYHQTDGLLPLRIFIPRATLVINGELEFAQKNDSMTGIPLQVKSLVDTANSNRLFVWQRVTAAATA